MKIQHLFVLLILSFFISCHTSSSEQADETVAEEFEWTADRFADIRVLRYQIPGFEKLSLDQKKLVYYLGEAGYSGRDIMYDMNYRHNLAIRKALEKIVANYSGDKTTADWEAFMTYAKRVWFANGIHHHYSMDKFIPGCSREYFASLISASRANLSDEVVEAIFDPAMDNKKVNLDTEKGLLKGSAVNFYAPELTEEDVRAYYDKVIDKTDKEPISYGLNSRMAKNDDGEVIEQVWSANGMYAPAIKEIISWLEKAMTVAENDQQKKGFELLIDYYKTGDLKTWDEYNVVWASTKEGDIDYINGFIEVYNDPIGFRGSYENIVQIKDFDASERMQVVSENAQWFEDQSPIMDEHKKESVVGISYNVVTVAAESGDASPATPIGVNLPNANWIRAKHGSKSVSLGNIITAYDNASGPGMTNEFAHDEEEAKRVTEYGELAGKLSTALHEVIGHASGKINEGVGTPKETLKNYASTLEEARADIVALYFILDPKIVELGLMPSLEVGKAEYGMFISNGLMKQLRRIEPGKVIEESHMRNRQLIAAWAYEKGQAENVIAKVERDGKTYYDITDYDKLRTIFGELLREIQRIKSEGDYEAGSALVENYGVQVDPEIHQEVLDRTAKLNIAPYSGFVNPRLVPVTDEDGDIEDIIIEYPDNFVEQMMEYGSNYNFLTR